jgi:hypothetical protein
VATTKAGSFSSKYGVITHTEKPAELASTLNKVESDWYIAFSSDVDNIPSGKNKLIYVTVSPSNTVLTAGQIQTIAAARPGSMWYVSGEPNVNYAVDDVIQDLRYYYIEIKSADPSAIITSPSILNWDFTCIGCGGYTSGESWMTSFVSRYQDLYGEQPPWDRWAIDLYPLDWQNFPNTGFEADVIQQYAPNLPPPSKSIPAKQVEGYRAYIDSLPGRAGEPIIVTEIGIHWGWSEITFSAPGCNSAAPAGEYKPIVVRDYFNSVFTWLEQHAVSHNIERWFTYITYNNMNKCRVDSYAGMSLLDAPGTAANLTDIGRWYVGRSAP